MSEQIYSTHSLDILFKKLGHDLVEIRTRALSSILSKLEHGLLHEADLVQERQLFIKLLEWFNFNPAPMKEEVFEIFLKLSCHRSACELLVSLGAVNFLTDLRPNLVSSLKPKLDTLLDRLFHITEGAIRDGRCTYNGSNVRNEHEHGVTMDQAAISGYFESSDDIDKEAKLTSEYCSDDAGSPSFITFSGFPWHFLTATDRHVLTSTGSSLCSTNSLLVQNACSFLLDVVFRDFPVEIFLQRPGILTTLLTLLKSQPSGSLMFTTCECISYIASNLLSRIFYCQDPELYCPRQGLPFRGGVQSNINSHDGIRQVRHGGDGRDENSVSSQSSAYSNVSPRMRNENIDYMGRDDDESIENDHTLALQLAQVSPHQFALSALQTVFPLLLNDSASLFYNLYEVASNCIQTLSHILDSDCLWIYNSNSISEMRSTISLLCEDIGRAVLHHYHLSCKKCSFSQPKRDTEKSGEEWCTKYESAHDTVFHRVAFHACSMMAIKFLKVVVPAEKSNMCIKDVLSTALYVISCDEPLRIKFCDECMVAEAYLERCSLQYCDILEKLHKVTQSIMHTHQFIDECKSSENNLRMKLELAESSIRCLQYYYVKGHIFLVVETIAEACIEENSNGDVALKILLRLLAHPLTRIRSETYESCLRIIGSNLNVTVAAENPSSGRNNICKFLFSTAVLYEISLHGVSDTSTLVTAPAQELMLCLLQSKMLMTEDVWQKFLKSATPVMPVLQSCMGETKLIRDAVFDFISQNFDFREKISCLLRCLLIKQREVRVTAGKKLQETFTAYMREMLVNEEADDALNQLLHKISSIVGIADLLIIEKPISLLSYNSSASPLKTGLFHEDVVVKMLSIFRSRSIEWPVRRSALQQMSVILCNPDNIEIFLKSDGLTTIKSHFIKLVSANNVLTDPERTETDACVSILKSVILHNRSIHASMANDPVTVLALLRMADLCRLSCTSLCHAVSTLALLLFHNVTMDHKIESDRVEIELSMPAGVLSHYQMPFLCPSHHVVSENKTLIPPHHSDPLFSGPAAFSIRIASALARNANNLSSTIQEYGRNQQQEKDVSREQLVALLIDATALKYSVPETCLTEIVMSLSHSNTHAAVRHIVCFIRIFLKANSLLWLSMLYRTNIWRVALEKFLCVLPSSAKDEALLLDILNMIRDLLSLECRDIPFNETDLQMHTEETVLWYLRSCMQEEICQGEVLQEKPLFSLLKFSDSQMEQTSGGTSVTVRRQLCKAILSTLSCISHKIMYVSNKEFIHRFQKELCQILLVRLKLADAPQFYDLPSMEVTLECLVQITAHPGWTVENDCTDLSEGAISSRELIRTLLEVVSAFHIESRGNSMSYMGKGVSRSATQCIVHLAIELAKNKKTASLLHEWLSLQHDTAIGKSVTVDGCRTTYNWMLPLWSARDPRIRLSGIALSVILTMTTKGTLLMEDGFQAFMGGLWNASFTTLFDDMECSAIRFQAASLLCNLTSHELFESDNIMHIPVLMDDTISSGTTKRALFAFLHQINFGQNVSSIISRYHSSFSIQPVTIFYSPFTSSNSTSTKNSYTSSPVSTVDEGGAINSQLNTGTLEYRMSQSQDATKNHRVLVTSKSELGKSLEQDCASANSYTSTFPSEWMTVCTPKLLMGVCRLLKNLVQLSPKEMLLIMHQERLLEHIGYLIDVPVLMLYFEKMKFSNQHRTIYSAQQLITTKALVNQFTETCKLLHICSEQDKSISFLLLENSQLITSVFRLLNVAAPFHTLENLVREMQVSAMHFLSHVVQRNRSKADDKVQNLLLNEWCLFSKSAQLMLSLHSQESLLLAVTTLLCNIMNFVFMPAPSRKNIVALDTNFDYLINETDTSAICAAVIEIFEKFSMKSADDSLKMLRAAAGTLQTMFSLSSESKKTASDMGFFESLLEGTKQLLCKVELLTTGGIVAKGTLKKAFTTKSGEYVIEKLIVYLKVFSNFLWGSEEVKILAWKSDVGNLLTKLYKFASISAKLKPHLLRFALSCIAACERGCTSLSLSLPGHQPFVCSVLASAKEFSTKIVNGGKVPLHNFQLTYHILVNLTLSQECRSLMWKSNFLNEFLLAADKAQHPKCTKLQALLLVAWLKLLHSSSFYKDGQNNILKLPDILEVLAGITVISKENSKIVLDILLNLSFNSSSKARISSNKAVVQLLIEKMSSKFQLTAITVVWALLSNSQKSKVHLKVAGLTPKVQGVLMHLNQTQQPDENEELKSVFMAVLEILET